MADVYDRWHLSRPAADAETCAEHSSKTRALVPSVDHGKGKRWQVRWRDAAGEQKKENFTKRSQADTRAATIEADLARGLYVDPAAGKESFRAVAERWRTSAVHRGGTSSRVERALRLHIYPTFADRPIVTIRPSEVQAWVKDRSQVLAPTTLRVTFAYLVTIMHTAVRDRTIAVNPCAGIKLPEVRRAEIVPLHADAVRALIEAAPARYRAMILLAAASGLRQGEVFGLEVDCIDFLRREVTVRQQLITPDKDTDAETDEAPEPYLGEPKTHESYRTVPLAGVAVDSLAAHLQLYPAVTVEIEDRTDPRKPKRRKAQMLFTSDRGEVIKRASWSHVWARMEDRANEALAKEYAESYATWVQRGRPDGAEPAPVRVPDGASMHDLRHFYASALIKNRESVKTVQRRLGHSKPSITLDIYTHLWPDDEDTTRAAVESVLGDVPALCPPARSVSG
ncbi:tyrosine-type recombinase/integrase [Streptomyces chiangmaiensis]|uniref:Tyrosine-type recombinase/integrase n=1 Tax=Streptomyces chiangmaiensis TaxID=766497 RepID=A0ABU7FRT7_9ACTN|nr:tyrosine-type recombinase/integrase [Streptomyces chiangmaiensis]MED7826812.1 tyrosine-type recombinase/integrase [Streptomyces chiangmaiensis]